MGKVILTSEQKFILEEFSKDQNLRSNFYFTGGTALSAFYLQHRLSEDLDFFSEKQFDDAPIISFVKNISSELKAENKFTKIHEVRIFELTRKNESTHDLTVGVSSLDRTSSDSGKPSTLQSGIYRDKLIIKVDFDYYPFSRIEPGKNIQGVIVDSIFDIAVNKLLTINQRTDVKDFVDLFFLLKKFTLWDLMEGVRAKFGMKIDPILAAADMLKVDNFENMPRMIRPLTLEKLKAFFREKAKEIGKTVVEY